MNKGGRLSVVDLRRQLRRLAGVWKLKLFSQLTMFLAYIFTENRWVGNTVLFTKRTRAKTTEKCVSGLFQLESPSYILGFDKGTFLSDLQIEKNPTAVAKIVFLV